MNSACIPRDPKLSHSCGEELGLHDYGENSILVMPYLVPDTLLAERSITWKGLKIHLRMKKQQK